ncbi:hypothetical protein RGQ15_07100 [Paracoccus sp. MBLB3053]|uniref:Helix-turn-helix domain-containing protein n=1 Tax=Paracoccus aurantius TaxID=3073814 RepID=A0ABU2HS04_9RHOB|nr:hypothetical protein [Paracoccus sp. MBLB3053]MDS9467340.1 hypothetical protein [Paracoccus sp. MBLB3053]
MTGLNTTELAARLAVSKARISQYVSEGKLDGCFSGDGRGRRFDLDKVANALGRRLHPGQMLGNGAGTREALRDLSGTDAPTPRLPLRSDSELPPSDAARYEMARTLKAEEEARRLRRQNMAEEGTWVLAEEVQRITARAMGQEIAQFETVIRESARAVADQFGLDFRSVRKVLMDEWRRYRDGRAKAMGDLAGQAAMTEDEREADS